MAFLTIVVIGDVRLVSRALGFLRLLGSANVYRARVCSVRGALGLSLLLVIGLIVSSRMLGAATLLLLSSSELLVVNADSLSDELVEYTGSVLLVEFILNVFL